MALPRFFSHVVRPVRRVNGDSTIERKLYAYYSPSRQISKHLSLLCRGSRISLIQDVEAALTQKIQEEFARFSSLDRGEVNLRLALLDSVSEYVANLRATIQNSMNASHFLGTFAYLLAVAGTASPKKGRVGSVPRNRDSPAFARYSSGEDDSESDVDGSNADSASESENDDDSGDNTSNDAGSDESSENTPKKSKRKTPAKKIALPAKRRPAVGEPKRPRSAYMHFAEDTRAKLREENPSMTFVGALKLFFPLKRDANLQMSQSSQSTKARCG